MTQRVIEVKRTVDGLLAGGTANPYAVCAGLIEVFYAAHRSFDEAERQIADAEACAVGVSSAIFSEEEIRKTLQAGIDAREALRAQCDAVRHLIGAVKESDYAILLFALDGAQQSAARILESIEEYDAEGGKKKAALDAIVEEMAAAKLVLANPTGHADFVCDGSRYAMNPRFAHLEAVRKCVRAIGYHSIGPRESGERASSGETRRIEHGRKVTQRRKELLDAGERADSISAVELLEGKAGLSPQYVEAWRNARGVIIPVALHLKGDGKGHFLVTVVDDGNPWKTEAFLHQCRDNRPLTDLANPIWQEFLRRGRTFDCNTQMKRLYVEYNSARYIPHEDRGLVGSVEGDDGVYAVFTTLDQPDGRSTYPIWIIVERAGDAVTVHAATRVIGQPQEVIVGLQIGTPQQISAVSDTLRAILGLKSGADTDSRPVENPA
ncbi:MAG: hypothetical protein AAB539_00300 [Patescibacteria group bacterium]